MKIAIIGYGKMGRRIASLAQAAGDEIVLKIDRDNQAEFTIENLQQADVAIEFSQPENAFANLEKCIQAKVPVVSGTTGWLDRKQELEDFCKLEGGAFLYASNFSIGVNLFFALNDYLAKLMDTQDQYEVSMEEIHHTQKLDAPSGTAITLAEGILSRIEKYKHWINEDQSKGEKQTIVAAQNEVKIISKREAEVPGTHAISYQSSVDRIDIRHTAHSRDGFAKGAIQAARWIIGKQGVFSMQDVLGF